MNKKRRDASGREANSYAGALRGVLSGNNGAKTNLAWFLLSGLEGAVVDEKRAVELLEERVKASDDKAAWMMGLCCEFGIGTERTVERAQSLYEQAIKAGNQTAVLLCSHGRTHGWGNRYLLIKSL